MLLQVAVPDDFPQLLQAGWRVIFEVGKHTAALPSDILGEGGAGPAGSRALGLRTPLARRLRTAQSAPPVVTGRAVLQRALVIGDPGGAAAGSGLVGAKKEGLAVERVLRQHGVQVDRLLAAGVDPSHAGPATLAKRAPPYDPPSLRPYPARRPRDLLRRRRRRPERVAAGRPAVQGRHLTRARRLPPLVVANACHRGRVSAGLPGLADEFMGRGVRNLVAMARAVTDEGAEEVCKIFYGVLPPGVGGTPEHTSPTLAPAILAGRRKLSDARDPHWDAYQLSGDPDFRFWDSASTPPTENEVAP